MSNFYLVAIFIMLVFVVFALDRIADILEKWSNKP